MVLVSDIWEDRAIRASSGDLYGCLLVQKLSGKVIVELHEK